MALGNVNDARPSVHLKIKMAVINGKTTISRRSHSKKGTVNSLT